MSKNLGAVASKLFDSAVKSAYQESSKLRQTVYGKSTKSANQMNFRTMGKALATEVLAPSADVTPVNIEHSLIPCDIKRWRASEYTDIFDASEVNFSEVNELGSALAQSLGRRTDQIILNALGATTVAPVGTTGTALTVDTLIEAKKVLDKKAVPAGDRVLVIESKGLADLLNETEVTSSDYNSIKALVAGDLNTFMGFKIIQLADREEGGIADDGTDFTAFVYHKRSIGYGFNMDLKNSTAFIDVKQSWLSVSQLSAGAVIIDEDGIVPITYGV